MLIAVAQMQSSADVQENLVKAETAVVSAARRGAQFIVFPEIYMAWMSPTEYRSEIAHMRSQSLQGSFVSRLSELARREQIWIAAGMLETSEDITKKVYNTTILFDAQGHLVTTYHKTHLFDAFGYEESDVFLPGERLFTPLETPFGRMGLFVCYELRFPEVARTQALRGVDFFIVPSAWVHGPMKEVHWHHLVVARAIENTAYVVACNQSGHQFLGRSLIVDPMGTVLSEGIEKEDLLFAEIDLQRVREVRHKVPCLEHVRSELYRPLVQNVP